MKIIVLTSNSYHHVLPGFAYCFNRYWPGQQPTVLHYDAPLPPLPSNFKTTGIGRQSDHTYSSGLMTYLTALPDHQFVLLLDDYWLSAPVDLARFFALIRMMHDQPDVDKIDLTDDRLKYPHDLITPLLRRYPMIESHPEAPYQTSLQAAIWRTAFLLRFLNVGENAWDFEKLGTRRVIAAREDGTYRGRIMGFPTPVMQYVNATGGGQGGEYHIFAKKRFHKTVWNELKARGFVDEQRHEHG